LINENLNIGLTIGVVAVLVNRSYSGDAFPVNDGSAGVVAAVVAFVVVGDGRSAIVIASVVAREKADCDKANSKNDVVSCGTDHPSGEKSGEQGSGRVGKYGRESGGVVAVIVREFVVADKERSGRRVVGKCGGGTSSGGVVAVVVREFVVADKERSGRVVGKCRGGSGGVVVAVIVREFVVADKESVGFHEKTVKVRVILQ